MKLIRQKLYSEYYGQKEFINLGTKISAKIQRLGRNIAQPFNTAYRRQIKHAAAAKTNYYDTEWENCSNKLTDLTKTGLSQEERSVLDEYTKSRAEKIGHRFDKVPEGRGTYQYETTSGNKGVQIEYGKEAAGPHEVGHGRIDRISDEINRMDEIEDEIEKIMKSYKCSRADAVDMFNKHDSKGRTASKIIPSIVKKFRNNEPRTSAENAIYRGYRKNGFSGNISNDVRGDLGNKKKEEVKKLRTIKDVQNSAKEFENINGIVDDNEVWASKTGGNKLRRWLKKEKGMTDEQVESYMKKYNDYQKEANGTYLNSTKTRSNFITYNMNPYSAKYNLKKHNQYARGIIKN